MRTIIAGSRTIDDIRLVRNAVVKSGFCITEIISGNARGVDRAGERYAKQAGIDLVIFPANWERHNRAAGPIRNERMARYAIADESRPGALIAIWDGQSRGSKNMIDTAKALGLKVFVLRVDQD